MSYNGEIARASHKYSENCKHFKGEKKATPSTKGSIETGMPLNLKRKIIGQF